MFSGSVFRMALQRRRPGPLIKETFYLSLGEDRRRGEQLMRHLYRDAKRSWFVDVVDFADAPKRSPALLYERHIATSAPRSDFEAGYFTAPVSLDADARPHASNPRGFGPAIRGAVEYRARDLELHRQALKLDSDEPWCDASVSYEHHWARVLLETARGYVECVWFLSTGVDGDPVRDLAAAVADDAARRGAEVVSTIGPHPANSIEFPGTGLSLGTAFRHFPDGVNEFEAKVVDLSAWTASA
jgi:hypothetical protein